MLIAQLISALAGLIFGGAAFLVRSNARRIGLAARTWPTAAARIVTAEVVQNMGGFSPLITYTYDVAGTPYANDSLRLGGNPQFTRQGKAAEIVASYPAGSGAEVRYDPAKPKRSTLELKSQSSLVIMFSIFAASSFGLAILLKISG